MKQEYGYELEIIESYWETPYGEKTMQIHCKHCKSKHRKSNAFQVFFEGSVIYFMCDNCCQLLDPVSVNAE
jgi:hypothetical protein